MLVLSSTFMLLLGLALIGFLPSCNHKSDSSPSPNNSTQVNVQGVVLSEDRKPLAGVAIYANGILYATSDAGGVFRISGTNAIDGRCVITAKADGYFNTIRAFMPQGGTDGIILTLARRENHVQINPASLGAITNVKDAKGFEMVLPANAFANGSALVTSGTVDMYYRYLSPKDDNLGAIMPGGDFMGKAADGSSASLTSYGAVLVDLEQNGQNLELAPGKTATIRFPANGNTDPTVPLWHLDEGSGMWIEEGKATLNGSYYEGTVSHFSPWNCDKGNRPFNFSGRILDCLGSPFPLLEVRFGQVTSYTDADGNFVLSGSSTQQFPFQCFIYGRWVTFDSSAINSLNLNIGTKTLCYQIPSYAIGKLTDCNQTFGYGLVMLVDENGRYISSSVPDGSGRFQFAQPLGKSGQIIFRNWQGAIIKQTITFPKNENEAR